MRRRHEGSRPVPEWRRCAAALLGVALLLAGCGPAARAAKSGPGTTGTRCAVPFNAGSRLPGFVNPAYPQAGLFPAPGGYPPSGAPGLVLKVRTQALVATYGQPLEHGAVTANNHMVAGQAADGGWSTLPLAAGYTFEVFGPAVPIFGIIPSPLVTGARAANLRYAWLVTQWDAVQAITLLRGTAALASAAQDWRQIPPGMSQTAQQHADLHIQAAEGAGWAPEGVYKAGPACGASADKLGPFGARAVVRLPLGVPLRMIVPEYGSITFTATEG